MNDVLLFRLQCSPVFVLSTLMLSYSLYRQFKEDLWTIVEKFGERVFQMRDLEKDWACCQHDFLEGIQHIVGKRSIILSLADPNHNSSSSASMSSTSLASSRRHSYIDFEIDTLRRDMEDMREDTENMQKELATAKQKAEEAKAQLKQLQLKSGPPSSSRMMRDTPECEPPTSFGKREVIVAVNSYFGCRSCTCGYPQANPRCMAIAHVLCA